MITKKVISSSVKSLSYSPEEETLIIEFHRKGVTTSSYRYSNVTEELWKKIDDMKSGFGRLPRRELKALPCGKLNSDI